jgi:hypothetical protein
MCLYIGMKYKLSSYQWPAMVMVFLLNAMAWASFTIEANPQKYNAHPGEIFPVEYAIGSQDAGQAFVVLAPELPALDWCDTLLLEERARSADGRLQTLFLVGFVPGAAGDYEIPPLEFRVIPSDQESNTGVLAVAADASAQLLHSTAIPVKVRSGHLAKNIALIFFVSLVFLLLLSAVVLRFKKKTEVENDGENTIEQATALLHKARRHRLDGDFYACYRALRQLCDLAAAQSGTKDEALCERLDTRIEDTGYRGVRPSDDMLEGDFKAVEKHVTNMKQHGTKES